MAIKERDAYTGYMTTGHEWNGIKELNRPIPKVVWIFIIVTHVFALVYWVLMPAWPLIETHTKGILGIDQHSGVDQDLRAAAMNRAAWTQEIDAMDFNDIQADAVLMDIVRQSGRPLFEDNCAVCHGKQAQGGKGFPSLTDDAWLWGGSPAQVAETIRVGVNSEHDETRVSQMLAFGRDQMLDRDAILNIVTYLQSFSDPQLAVGVPAEVEAGRDAFAANCVACHGEDGRGNADLGAPDLTDAFWIYGGDRQSIYSSIYGGRQGHMPQWEGRLSPVDRKILTLYVLDAGAAAQ